MADQSFFLETEKEEYGHEEKEKEVLAATEVAAQRFKQRNSNTITQNKGEPIPNCQ